MKFQLLTKIDRSFYLINLYIDIARKIESIQSKLCYEHIISNLLEQQDLNIYIFIFIQKLTS